MHQDDVTPRRLDEVRHRDYTLIDNGAYEVAERDRCLFL